MLYRNIDLNCLWIVLCILRDIWYDFDDATTWHIGMYIYYMMKLYDDFIWWWDVIRTRWWLRSITGSYGRTCDRQYMGRLWFTPSNCLGDISSRRVVGVSSWCITHARHIQVNTNMGTVYDIFWFSWYKNLYVLCF